MKHSNPFAALPIYLATIVLALPTVGTLPATAGDHWPSFRGPDHTGVAPDAKPPTTWSEDSNIAWKVALDGIGHASPVVWGDRIFILSSDKTDEVPATTESEANSSDTPPPPSPSRSGRPPKEKPTHIHRFLVTAHDLKNGEPIWKTVVKEEVPHESLHSTASQASGSPVTDGKHVWAFFGSRGLYCLDAKNGKVVWSVDLGEQRTRNAFGEGASPVVHGEFIVINWDHEDDSFIVALDKKTGKERWRKSRNEPTSWSTPLVVKDGARDVLVSSAANAVRGYDLRSGEELWRASGLGLNVVPTPVADDSTVWTMSGWREAHGMAIRYAGARGDLTGTDRITWEADSGLSYVPSAVLVDERIYFFQRFTGILSCYSLSDGKACYDRQRIDEFENIYASPVAANGNIYAVSRDGDTVVFAAGDKFEFVARNTLDDVFNATPAIVGNALILRGDRNLYRIEATPETPSSSQK